MKNIDRKAKADRILYEFGLLDMLKKIGKPHIIGSYRMNMMACNDLDIDIENNAMSREKLYKLTTFIINTYNPTWYEAKEEINDEGKIVWFHGFETTITGELWNVDLWFFDNETISKAEAFCDNITDKASEEQKELIINIKNELIARGIYSFDKYTSMDVYKAVLEYDIHSIDEFLLSFSK